jgi:hypothetical protein
MPAGKVPGPVHRIGVYPIDVYLIGIDLFSVRLKRYIF